MILYHFLYFVYREKEKRQKRLDSWVKIEQRALQNPLVRMMFKHFSAYNYNFVRMPILRYLIL